ncbi:MAG: ribbon-helix-helix protein, CopG family [Nitrospirae bacterium]|nr:ribbon-helix-helix protein, CopG family [Nitrospirota bacterium]
MRTTKVMTLSIPPEMLKEVDKLTKEEKRTKSELFREALRKYINDKRWQQIRQWGMKTAQGSGLSTEEDVDKLIHAYRRKSN